VRTLRRLLLVLLALGAALPAGAQAADPPAAPAPAGWKGEFEAICARTQDAMALPADELRALVERCDRLAPAVEALAEPERRVFSRRLRACRELYAYVLASRQANP
jgi:hypothetical protein